MTTHLHSASTAMHFEGAPPVGEYPHATIGTIAEQAANGLTAVRGIGAIALNRYIVNTEEYQSWKTAAAFGLLALTDAEGKLARWGRNLQGKDEDIPRPFQSYIDHLTDKGLVDGTMAAIAERERLNDNAIYAGSIAAATGVTVVRDVATTVDRMAADWQGIDTRAQKSGKKKALLQYLVIGFALSPLARTRAGKTIAAAGMTYTAKESVTSGWKLHRSFSEQRHQQKHVSDN